MDHDTTQSLAAATVAAPEALVLASEPVRRIVGSVPRMQAAFIRGCVDRELEALDFLERRCDAQYELAKSVETVDTGQELIAAYAGFFQTAASQYSSFFGKLVSPHQCADLGEATGAEAAS